MTIVNILKEITPPFFWRLLKWLRLRLIRYHGQWKIDRKIEKYLNFDNGYYVELGALDGIGLSNTLYYELNRNWTGVLIEPAPNNYLKCLGNRSAKANKIYCNACTSFDYTDCFVDMTYSHYMTVGKGLDSDVDDPTAHALSGENFLGSPNEKVFRFGAIAATLNSLLLTSKSPSLIDFLSLDVEGAELEVLKGVDHTHFKFKVICVESRNVERLSDFLLPLGYEYIEQISPHDYVYVLANEKNNLGL